MDISRNSWHYKLVSFYNTFPSTDFCQYCRQVFISIIITAVLAVALFIVFPGAIGVLFICFYNWLITGTYIPTEGVPFLKFLSVGYISILILSLIGYLFIKFCVPKIQPYIEKIYTNTKEREPSLFSLWYKSFKGKYCSIIKFKD